MNNRGSVSIILLAFLGVIYLGLFMFSTSGWGYMGYRGYSYGPSWWYFGGPRYYYGNSVRQNSWGGRSHQGGGLRGGK